MERIKYIISGKADADAQISATDFEGKEFSVKRNGTDFNIEKEETKSYNINGTSVCYITVKKGTVSEKYKVLISGKADQHAGILKNSNRKILHGT